MTKIHVCRSTPLCLCNIMGSEPNEECSIHGFGETNPRCDVCGKFIPHYIHRTNIYEIDERLGCIAIRDKRIQNCSPGLTPQHKNVIAYFSWSYDYDTYEPNENEYKAVIEKIKIIYDALCYKEYYTRR